MNLRNNQVLESKILDMLKIGKDQLMKFGVFLEEMGCMTEYSHKSSLYESSVDYSVRNGWCYESNQRWEEYRFSLF